MLESLTGRVSQKWNSDYFSELLIISVSYRVSRDRCEARQNNFWMIKFSSLKVRAESAEGIKLASLTNLPTLYQTVLKRVFFYQNSKIYHPMKGRSYIFVFIDYKIGSANTHFELVIENPLWLWIAYELGMSRVVRVLKLVNLTMSQLIAIYWWIIRRYFNVVCLSEHAT